MQAVVTADVGKRVIVVVVDAAKMFRNKMGMKLGRRRPVFEPQEEGKLDWTGAVDALGRLLHTSARYAAATHTRTRALTQIPGPDMSKFKFDGVEFDYGDYFGTSFL
jgi:hypothetical protein